MAQLTEEVERQRVETYTEEETYWICDDCGLECKEDEMVPVVVDPDKVGEYRLEAGSQLRKKARSTLLEMGIEWEKSGGGIYDINGNTDRAADSIVDEVVKGITVETPDVECAGTFDVCPDCLKDDYGLEVESMGDGSFYDVREVERVETVRKAGYWHGLSEFTTIFIFSLSAILTMILIAGGMSSVSAIIFMFGIGLFLFSQEM